MRIIGIDPGTGILGFGVIDVNGAKLAMVDAGVITTPAHTPLDVRLEEIYDGLTEIIAATKPEVMSIEKLFFSPKRDNRYECVTRPAVSRCSLGAKRDCL